MVKLIKSKRPAAPPAAADETSIWYIEARPGRPGFGLLRRWLAEQGIRQVEIVTDRVARCWADRAPVLPVDWGCVVARGDAAVEDRPASSDPLPPAPGALVRIQSGPAAGWVGRVQAVERDQVVVEILVWGKGMTVRVPVTATVWVEGLPWERGAADRG